MTEQVDQKTNTRLNAILREPTLHFALLAGALFLGGTVLGDDEAQNEIEIDRAEVAARVLLIEESTGTRLTPEQRQQVEDDFIDEQILVREARALGLDEDPQIHDFLAQKMLHVLSADVIQPGEGELEAYFDLNRERYAPVAAVSVEELVIAVSDVQLPEVLTGQLEAGVAAEDLDTDLPLRSNLLSDVTARDLTDIFGSEMGERAFDAPLFTWVGPHLTVRGQHWLRVTSRTEPVPPPLEIVREQVRLDWIVEQEEALLRERVARIRDLYSITFVGSDSGP